MARDAVSSSMSSLDALDAAFAGRVCELVRDDGSSKVMATYRWSRAASATDVALFVTPCHGADLGRGV